MSYSLLLVFAWSSVMLNIRPIYEWLTGSVMDYQSPIAEYRAMLADGKPHDVRVFLAEGRTDYNDLTDAALEAEFRERINAEG